jgi:hypothetical protein
MALLEETITGTLGHVGTPGAPIFHFVLDSLIGAGSDATLSWSISGKGEITQAITPPDGQLVIQDLQGKAYSLGPSIFVALTGSYILPSSGATLPFEAIIHFTSNWNSGSGSFSYGGHRIYGVPVHATVTSAGQFPPIIVLYGAAIQEAINTGDLGKMKQIAAQAESWLSNSDEVAKILNDLKDAIKRLDS